MSSKIDLLSFLLGMLVASVVCSLAVFSAPSYQDAYKQGQIDCLEGRVKYIPDTTTNYIEIP